MTLLWFPVGLLAKFNMSMVTMTGADVMLVAISLLFAAGTADVALKGETQLQGRCRYGPAIQAHRDDTVLATCDAVAIERSAGTARIVYSQRSWGVVMMRFDGEWEGDRMAVTHLVLRDGTEGVARGSCEVFRREGRVSTVSCLATRAGRAYAANFETSRLGD